MSHPTPSYSGSQVVQGKGKQKASEISYCFRI